MLGDFVIKAVLFDLDGTLANSLFDLAFATNRALKMHGFCDHEVEAYKYFVGDGIPKMIERALPENARDKATIEMIKADFTDYYKDHHSDRTKTYDGVPELLSKLKSMGLALAVVTNKAEPLARLLVYGLLGENTFNVVNGQREGIPNKPDPTLALLTMKELGVAPEECVFIGDSGMDVLAGVNAGAYPVGELWGYRGEDELRANGAKVIIEKPMELVAIIEELNA